MVATGGVVGTGSVTGSGGSAEAVSTGGVVASGGAGGLIGGADGGMPGTGGVITQLGWLPCAKRGTTATPETCVLPAGATKVIFGDVPEAGGHNLTKIFPAGSSFTCSNASFSTSANPAGQPNPSCSSCDAYCWYEGPVTGLMPSGPLTGPAITLPLFTTAFPGFTQARIRATNQFDAPVNINGGAAFRDECTFAKFDFNDPIVFPGQPEASHLHLFFGNTAVTETSTPDSIQNSGSSTCGGGTLNRSAYWVPAMIDNATHMPVRPNSNNAYYKNGGITPMLIRPVPRGLSMVTGSAANTVSGVNPVRYSCVSNSDAKPWTPNIPVCPDSTYELIAEFTFPQCWDGVHLDSADHKSHMSGTSSFGVCPADHPISLPLISFNIRWPVPAIPGSTATYQLSSDNYPMTGSNAGYSGHADYMYGWDDGIMTAFTTNCIDLNNDCHDYLTGDGHILF